MDIVFYCPSCNQELEVDASGVGSEIECPACQETITIPEAGPENIRHAQDAMAREEKHFKVPTDHSKTESLIAKPHKPLEVTAKETDKTIRVKSIRRAECIEVGKDKFDETVTKFLNEIGEENIVNIETVNYSTVDMNSQKIVDDYGVLIVFRG